MEINERLIFDLLLWCVNTIPEKKDHIAISGIHREDIKEITKEITITNENDWSKIRMHLHAMVQEEYFIQYATPDNFYGISIKGQEMLNKLRKKYAPKEFKVHTAISHQG